MTHEEMRKFAIEVLKTTLGFRPRLKDIVLLESGEGAKGLDYLLFGLASTYKAIQYSARLTENGFYTVEILNEVSDLSMFLGYMEV
jgi:hypothetical protein